MQLLLAQTWEGQNPEGWWISEKLDGVRAYWDGVRLLTRNGNALAAPPSFVSGLPPCALDGELWQGRGRFNETVGIVRRQAAEAWPGIQYCVFDAPDAVGGFEDRQVALGQLPGVTVVTQLRCEGRQHLTAELARVIQDGGEGLMLRAPGSLYERKRSRTLLKVKHLTEHDIPYAEAVVVGHEAGNGKHAGRLGALIVRAGRKTFGLGTGLTDFEREHPPGIGARVTYQYQELTPDGMPRFPVYLRVAG